MTPTDIPQLPTLDLAVEELIRTVQECGDTIRRRDVPTITAATEEVKRLTEDLATRTSITRKEAMEAIRQCLRGFIMIRLIGDEMRGDWDAMAALEQAEPVRLDVPRTVKVETPTESCGDGKPGTLRILEQLHTAANSALENAEGLHESTRKYTRKCAAEDRAERRAVYEVLAVASHDASRLHLEIAKIWKGAFEEVARKGAAL